MAPRLIRRFTETLSLLGRGTFEQKCNLALTEALESLTTQPTEKGKAKISVTLDLTFEKGMVQITPSIVSKLPETDKAGPTIFWEHEGALSTQHPSQIDLEDAIREAPRASGTA